ncbi:LPS-assembly protein LptD [Sphingomonas sp. LY160]|uniref:LPS-assembly protein LptD n=1 Tax=Sphingomonas sp. LY160 TaxID=3095342 RepID=UPI002ADECB26|nr:LPS assembly protein LptD [Sphingomonas sp. LY160]MEA1071337.1 LPS assembly protein LptD [Sphingomonas sp. LY160]
MGLGASALAMAWATPALAQDVAVPLPAAPIAPAPVVQAEPEPVIDFSADEVVYVSQADIVTATGQVRLSRDGNYLAADRVGWDRNSGKVVAEGNVVIVNPQGDKLIGDRIDLTDSLKDGTIDNLLVVLESGGRIAATKGERRGDKMTLTNAVYSACPVVNENGCPRNPSWKITAARVVRDESTGRIRFTGGRINILGLSLPLLPIFVIGDGSQEGGVSGALLPGIRLDSNNGLEVSLPYYFRMDRNRDLTVTPHLYTGAAPALEGRFRHLTSIGAYQLGAFVTYGDIEDPDTATATSSGTNRGLRAYVEGNGRFQLDPYWTINAALRVASDKTVARRYDLTRDDKFRNFINAERISLNSYVSIAGWAFQGLRADDVQRQIPIALPAIDARFRLADPVLGGQVEVQANSLAILRRDGQDTQRAFASAQWNLRRVTGLGQELTLTAFGRADAYHSDENEKTTVALYRGEEGWQFRGIGALAADMRWPFIGELWGGAQRLTPRVQLVLSPPTPNLSIPNEDSRAVDLEDSNLFALNRFPGHDRWEDGSRITYGVQWDYDRPNWSIQTVVGQSYRLAKFTNIYPDGTGLTDRLSDVVGRTRVRFGNFVDLTHRYRIDKDSFAVRRNELDLTVGSSLTYAQVGYLRLNRDISTAIEDLRDKEELRLAGRWQFRRYWAVYGSTVLDLSDAEEDPLSLADGFEPVRHRLGITYEDECLELGVAWKRDYERIGELRKGSTFSINFALKGIGR